MGRKSAHNLPPGIQQGQPGVLWATLEGADAKLWKQRYPGRALPRRKATDLKGALKLQRQLVDDLKAARDPNAENPKVSDWVRSCIDRKRDLAASTATRYRSSLTWQIEPHPISRLRLQQVTNAHIEAWVDASIAQKHFHHADRTLDPYSIRNAFALLRLSFNMAIAKKWIVVNPCAGVKLPRPDDEEIHPLTPEQVTTFLYLIDTLVVDIATGTAQPHRNAALYHIALRCGLRQAELMGLRWKDIDLDRGVLHVAGQLKQGQRSTRGKSTHARRAHPLSMDTVAVLRWHKRNQAEEKRLNGKDWNSGDLVFVSDQGTPLRPNNLDLQFDRLLKRFELPDIRFHDMRHTYAALNIASGTDLYTLSRRMGHSSITVTADRYGHLYQGNSQDAESLDRLLKRSA